MFQRFENGDAPRRTNRKLRYTLLALFGIALVAGAAVSTVFIVKAARSSSSISENEHTPHQPDTSASTQENDAMPYNPSEEEALAPAPAPSGSKSVEELGWNTTETTYSVRGDPHFQGFDGSKFDFHGWDHAVFNIMSHDVHQVNALFDSYGDTTYNGTWMFAFGMRYGTGFSFTLELDLVGFSPMLLTDAKGLVRMVPPSNKPFVKASVNGADATSALGSGESFATGDKDVTLHFAHESAKHPGELFDGPLAVMKTPELEVTFYLETEGVIHLDVNTRLLGDSISHVEGVLGQTLYWKGAPQPIDGKDYVVSDGLLGTKFARNVFSGKRDQHSGRLLLVQSDISDMMSARSL